MCADQPSPDRPISSFWTLTQAAGLAHRFIADVCTRIELSELGLGGALGAALASLEGASVLIASAGQLPAALALLELDGVARRILLCPPDLAPEHLPAVIAEAQVDVVVSDGTVPLASVPPQVRVLTAAGMPAMPAHIPRHQKTEWVLFTSGTTGGPKLVVHSLSSLIGPLAEGPAGASGAVWSTFYDIRRYGGLQVLFRALLGGGSLVLSHAGEPVQAFLRRAAQAGVTHILGTPTHWRRALMSPGLAALTPRYVRVSGEIADQAILNQLARAFPAAGLTHAYASTEAGVGFEVTDGLEGFPASVLGVREGGFEIRVANGSLRVRSPRAASHYLGRGGPLADAHGFIDTGDMVTRRGDRYYFAGRRSGVINVGGQKVHPEEVEAVITRHPRVHMAQVRGRRSPITGALVVADVVLRPADDARPFAELRHEILASCRAALPAHKVPAMLREVAELPIAASGKLARG